MGYPRYNESNTVGTTTQGAADTYRLKPQGNKSVSKPRNKSMGKHRISVNVRLKPPSSSQPPEISADERGVVTKQKVSRKQNK